MPNKEAVLSLDGYENKRGVFIDLEPAGEGQPVVVVCRYNGKYGVVNRRTKKLEEDYLDSYLQASQIAKTLDALEDGVAELIGPESASGSADSEATVTDSDVVMSLSEFHAIQEKILEQESLEKSRAKTYQKPRYNPITTGEPLNIPTDVKVINLERNAVGGYLVTFNKALCSEHSGTPIYIDLDKLPPAGSKIQRMTYAILKHHLDLVVNDYIASTFGESED